MNNLIITLIITILLALFIFIYHQNNHLSTSNFSINSNIKNSLKVVHLSDLHSKKFGNHNSELFENIATLAPDLIVITGDTVNDNGKKLDDTLSFIKLLENIAQTVCILGNHECRSEHHDLIVDTFRKNNINLLRNEIRTFEINGTKVNILGLEENQGTFEAYNEMKNGTFKYTDNTPMFDELRSLDGLNIVLSHYPENYALAGKNSYNQFDFDAMFSGHAHGGQIILPFIGGLLAPGQGFFPRYYNGLYDNRLIVSRGLGNSFIPMRVFNFPNIVEVVFAKN